MTPPQGVHDGISEADYHGDTGALSASSARWLLPPSTPAVFRWRQDHPDDFASTKAFDFGSAAHKTVLGIGQPIRYVHAKDWRTKAAQQEATAARALGEIPLLAENEGILETMLGALQAHPLASRLLAPGTGRPEQSLYCRDPDTGVMLRGRLDWLPYSVDGQRLVISDYKTALTADPDEFGKAAANNGYDMSAAWYRDLCIGLGLDPDPGFLHIVQEKAPPYQVNVIQLNAEAFRIGRIKARRAISTYSICVAANTWPSYPADVAVAALPTWHTRQYEDTYQ